LGDGSKIRLWHEMWCEDQTLGKAFVLRMLPW
jgi:hypothetical protein